MAFCHAGLDGMGTPVLLPGPGRYKPLTTNAVLAQMCPRQHEYSTANCCLLVACLPLVLAPHPQTQTAVQADGTVLVSAPPAGDLRFLAPTGWYMLFLLGQRDTYSEGVWVQLTA